MPVYQDKNISNFQKLGVWKLSETKEELLELAKNISINQIELSNLKHENRIKQWVATRLLLNHFLPNVEIVYNELGKPFLNNGWNISISHTIDFVAILLNKKEHCGIDIEKISPKVEKIKHKFLNKIDLQKIISEKDLTIYWSAKEALYKYYGKKEVLFIEHLFIKGFDLNQNNFKGIINMPGYQKEVALQWEQIEDSILVYSV